MKILLATGIYPPDIGGPATYTKTLAQNLAKLGHQVKIVTYSNENKQADEKSLISVYRISRQQNIFWRYLKYFFKVWRLSGWADIVYVQGPISEGLPSWLACAIGRKKFILKIVGDYAWEQGRQRFGIKDLLDDFQDKKYSLKVELMRFGQKKVAQAASIIIVPSYYLKSIVKKWGIAGSKIKVIYNAVVAPKIKISRQQAKEKLGLKGDIIISVGRLVPWKGFGVLVGLMPDLLKINPAFRLIIIGEGKEQERLKVQIKELGLKDKVKILDKMPPQSLWTFMRAADFFVLNSAYEGLPHIVIEAMSLELPVIVSNIGGNREVVKHKQTGWLVELNNKQELKEAILELWQNKELASFLARSAGREVRKFSYQTMLDNLIKVFYENFKY